MRSKILTADVLFLRDEFFKLTELQREVFLDLVDPQPEVAPMKSKPTKPATKRVIERCDTCGATRRHLVHKDTNSSEYHEFQSPQSSSKSKRAESLAGAIKKKTGDKEPRCVVCFEVRDHANHDLDNSGHLFEASVSARAMKALEKYEICHALIDDNGGQMECGKTMDDNIHHKQTDPDYHEFIGSETAVGVGGG